MLHVCRSDSPLQPLPQLQISLDEQNASLVFTGQANSQSSSSGLAGVLMRWGFRALRNVAAEACSDVRSDGAQSVLGVLGGRERPAAGGVSAPSVGLGRGPMRPAPLVARLSPSCEASLFELLRRSRGPEDRTHALCSLSLLHAHAGSRLSCAGCCEDAEETASRQGPQGPQGGAQGRVPASSTKLV